MRLAHPFYRFPFTFDVARLQREVGAIEEENWCRHPLDYAGNSALPLISSNGEINDSYEAPMRPTQFLERCPYIKQILGHFRTLLGRSRLMRLEPGHGVPPHVDLQYYWRNHARVHIPVVTNPEIRFHCGSDYVHMAAGEAWTFDNWRPHQVVNQTPTRRIHLTFDTLGSTAFWGLAQPYGKHSEPQLIPFQEGAVSELLFESYSGDPVMSPHALDLEFFRLLSDVTALPSNDPSAVRNLQSILGNLRNEWTIAWHSLGPTEHGLNVFLKLIEQGKTAARQIPATLKLASNGVSVPQVLDSIFPAMVKPSALAKIEDQSSPSAAADTPAIPALRHPFDRPIFIVSAPRSGSTLLFETLAEHEALWTVGRESHGIIEQIEELAPGARNWDSNRLVAGDATPAIRSKLVNNFLSKLRTADNVFYREFAGRKPEEIRFLEKTPKNALRIPFFKKIFPDAKFIFLHREARANISSIMEAWRSGNFVTYRELPGWNGLPWSLLLIPGWRELNGKDLATIAMRQWRDTNEIILGDLAAIPEEDWCHVRYEDVLANTGDIVEQLCIFAGVPVGARLKAVLERPLRFSRTTLTAPDHDKWRKNEKAIDAVLDEARHIIEVLDRFAARSILAREVSQ